MKVAQQLNARRLACFSLLVVLLALAGAVWAAPARQDPYPVPQQPTADPFAPLPTPSAYPAPLPTAITPAPIGGPLDGQPVVGLVEAAPDTVTQASPGEGALYLWLGFIATLLIFTASVIGAVMLFNRRVQP